MIRYLLYSLGLVLLLLVGQWQLQAQEQALSGKEVGLSLVDTALRVEASSSVARLSAEDSLQIQKSKLLADGLRDTWKPDSQKALLWALLPGGGQIYNRKYWKLPIVWGALATCGYFIGFNGRMYQEYHAAYRDILSADPSTNTAWLAFAPLGTKAEDYEQYRTRLQALLKRGNDYYRRYRDLSIVLAIGVYGLSVLDAYVDAELFTFDISPDLSMRVAPTLLHKSPMLGGYQVGMGCQVTF